MNVPLHLEYHPDCDTTVARFREAGDATLDLHHRDGRVEDRWLDLHPREFALLWRLAARPGERLTARQLCAEAWRIPFATEADAVPAYLTRLRARLAAAGLGHLVATDPGGRHFLQVPSPHDRARATAD